jgi:spermidine synthase
MAAHGIRWAVAVSGMILLSIGAALFHHGRGNAPSAMMVGATAVDPDKTVPVVHATSEFIEETGFYQSLRLTNAVPLYQKQSKYQTIEVHESDYYGKILILDRVLQLTERDANAYNEMLAHIPMFQHQSPQRVLVIGGGDGYVLSEVLKHPSVTHVDHVDLDEDVVETCREHFSWGNAWKDPRVKLHIADGAAFVRDAADGSYDVIVQDSSDPWTYSDDGEKIILPSSVLYSEQHFMNIYRILGKNGVLAIQAESLQIPSDFQGIREWRDLALRIGFESARYSSITISSYPTGQIGLLCVRSLVKKKTVVRSLTLCHPLLFFYI